MVVVDITSFFSLSCGGIKTYYREKARWMPGRGVTCHFVVPGARRRSTRFGEGVLHELPGPSMFGSRHYRMFGDVSALVELVAALGPDVVEVGSHYLLPELIERGWRRGGRRPAVVGFYHADYPDTYVAPSVRWLPRTMRDRAEGLAWRLVRRHHERYRATLVASKHVGAKLRAHGVPRLRWVGLGVDLDRFAPRRRAGGPPIVAYAGRLAAEKGFPLLLAGADEIHARTGAVIRIAGDGPLAARAGRLAADRAHVQLVGHLGSADAVAALMAEATVLVAPGPHESFSLATAEAMACATPVVGADAGGNGELIRDSGGGLAFAPGDPAALANSVVELLSADEPRRAAMGRAGRDYVARSLSWSHVAGRIHDVYSEVA